MMDDHIAPHRLRGAREALEQAHEMLSQTHLIDTILLYLQSWEFFFLWFGTGVMLCGYRLLRVYFSRD